VPATVRLDLWYAIVVTSFCAHYAGNYCHILILSLKNCPNDPNLANNLYLFSATCKTVAQSRRVLILVQLHLILKSGQYRRCSANASLCQTWRHQWHHTLSDENLPEICEWWDRKSVSGARQVGQWSQSCLRAWDPGPHPEVRYFPVIRNIKISVYIICVIWEKTSQRETRVNWLRHSETHTCMYAIVMILQWLQI